MTSEDLIDERVSIASDGGVAHVRLRRPEKMNALDLRMFRAIEEAIGRLSSMDALRAVVLSGDGPSFCAGLDLSFGPTLTSPEGLKILRELSGSDVNMFQRVVLGWRDLEVPVIAALHGHVLGGGLQIALGSDVRISAPDAKLSVLELRRGIVPDMGGTLLLRELVRADVMRDIVFSSRILDATEAQSVGLVTRLSHDPLSGAMEMAREIARSSAVALAAAKRLMNAAPHRSRASQLGAEREEQDLILTTSVFDREAMAFVRRD